MGDDFEGCFEQSLVGVESKNELLMHHLRGIFEQLYLLLSKPQSDAEGHHLILLIEKNSPYTDKVDFIARMCDCGASIYQHLTVCTGCS